MTTREGPYAGPVAGLVRSVAGLVATLLSIARTRLDLLSTELREEVQRAAELLVLAFVALFTLGIALIMAGFAVILYYWNVAPVTAAIGVTLFFLLVAVMAGLVLARKARTGGRIFGATIDELDKDLARLRGDP
jgi:uncharacterized membrane protein YqjE